jgi:hypothetical protein
MPAEVWIVVEADEDMCDVWGVYASQAAADAEVVRVEALADSVEAALPPRPDPPGGWSLAHEEAYAARYDAYRAAGVFPDTADRLAVRGPYLVQGGP